MKKIRKLLLSTVMILAVCAMGTPFISYAEDNRDELPEQNPAESVNFNVDDIPLGFAGTKMTKKPGGAGKKTVTVSTADEFKKAIKDGNKVIYVEGIINFCSDFNADDIIKKVKLNSKYSSYEDFKTKYLASCKTGKESDMRNDAMSLRNEQVNMVTIRPSSNLTIIGKTKDAALINLSLELENVSNIVIRNLKISTFKDRFPVWNVKEGYFEAKLDIISIISSKKIWIDHCTVGDSEIYPSPKGCRNVNIGDGTSAEWYEFDGHIDISKASDYITVSNCHILNCYHSCLIGSSDKDVDDKGRMHVSVLNNFYDSGYNRLPRVRFGTVHVANNYYRNVAYSCLGIGKECNVLAEANYFDATCKSVINAFNKDGTLTFTSSNIVKSPKQFHNRSVVKNLSELKASTFNPEKVSGYTYSLINASDVPAFVQANAGSGREL